MTTPPGWYPDPGHTGSGPALERWWDGSAWTDHTREAPPAAAQAPQPGGFGPPQPLGPPYGPGAGPGQPVSGRASSGTKVAVLAGAAVLLVAAIVGGVALLGFGPLGGDDSGSAESTASGMPGPDGEGDGGAGGPGEDGGQPPESADRAMDAANGIYLPVPEGWVGRSGSGGAGLTTGQYPCPAAEDLTCVRGGVNSMAADGYRATTAEGIAKEDIEVNAEESYGETEDGVSAYGGIKSHKQLKSEAVTVAGRKGWLVRWKLDTAKGDDGIVQSVAFPSPVDEERFVVVRFGFDAGDEAPGVSEMDEITEGIEPLAGDGTGGSTDGRAV